MRKKQTRIARLLGVLLAVSGASVWDEAAALEIGQPAPDFTLPSTAGKDVSLRDFRGKKVVLIEFYGGVEFETCAANLSARKVDYDKFEALGVQVLGISNDHPFAQKNFADSAKLPYPLLSDVREEVIKRYGVVYGSIEGVKVYYPEDVGKGAARAFFLIDRQGVVRGRWFGEDMEVFPSAALLKSARELAASP